MNNLPEMLRIPLISSLFYTINALVHVQLRKFRTQSSTIAFGISDLRKEYSKRGLIEQDLPMEPFTLFKTWFKEACDSNILEPNAMCLSTCVDNKPSARIVLLKDFDENGFVWYTNYQSRKSMELEKNPYASLTFWYGDLERSIRIEGEVQKVSIEESTKYFHSRPRGSQIGAWSSSQSQPIANREVLDAQEVATKAKFQDSEIIPLPLHWGGFRLKPNKIEFWKGRESRMHDRILFELCDKYDDNNILSNVNNWKRSRLQP